MVYCPKQLLIIPQLSVIKLKLLHPVLAIGQVTNASAHGAVALGNGAQSNGVGSTSLGRTAKAQNDGAVAVGFNAEATGDHAIAIGGDGKGAAFTDSPNNFAGLNQKLQQVQLILFLSRSLT